jgi:signal transduction histidine kinase
MKRPASWRLSRRLLWGFALVAAVPILVVGIGVRHYTRTLLERSFAERVDLTRRLVTGWREQLQQRAWDAVAQVAADSAVRAGIASEFDDRVGLSERLKVIATQTGVDGLDLIMRHDGGVVLVSRSGERTHFGFPVQAPEPSETMTVWSIPELRSNGYGLSRNVDAEGYLQVAAYHDLDRSLLLEIGETSSFLLGSRNPGGPPLLAQPAVLLAWPDLPDLGEPAMTEVGDETFLIGRVDPFYFGLSLEAQRTALARLDLVLVLATILALAVAVLAAWRVAYSAVRPVEELAETVGHWGRGGDLRPLVTFAEGEAATLVGAFEHLRRELVAAQKRLSDAARAAGWQEMARKVAHEIKNPLTPIRVTMEDLARQAVRSPADAAQMIPEAARLVAEEVAVLRRIVDAFARFAKLPEPELVDTDLSAVAKDTAKLYSSEGPRSVEVHLPARPVQVQVDPQLLREALANLVKNGLEATAGKGPVRVTVHDVSCRGRIVVDDHGPGFSQEILDHGPRPYFTTKKEGTGLGLIMAQRIITDMGGEMELANAEGGARVVVSFALSHG